MSIRTSGTSDPDRTLTYVYDDRPHLGPPLAARPPAGPPGRRWRWPGWPRMRRRRARRGGRRWPRLKRPHPVRRAGDALVFLTSADGALIGSRHERHRYATVGLLMLVTALQAWYAATLFFSVSLGKPFRGEVAFGVFFAVAVLLIDRSIISYAAPIKLDRQGTLRLPKKTNWVLGIRVVIALAAALLMSEMILLQVFAGDIKLQIQNDHLAVTQTTNGKIEANFQARINKLQNQVSGAQKTVSDQVKVVNSDYAAMNCQEFGCRGIAAGIGPGFYAAQKKYNGALAQLGDEQQQLRTISATNGSAITALNAQEQAAITRAQPAITNADKVLSQEEAFWQLTVANGTVLVVRVLLSLLILGIDLAPILTKLTGRTSIHDIRAHSGDYRLIDKDRKETGVALHQYAGQAGRDRHLHDLAMDADIFHGEQEAGVDRNADQRRADVARADDDAYADVRLYQIGLEASLDKLRHHHRYRLRKLRYSGNGTPWAGNAGNGGAGGNGNGGADQRVSVSFPHPAPPNAATPVGDRDDDRLAAPVPDPYSPGPVISDLPGPDLAPDVPLVPDPDPAPEPDDDVQLDDASGIWEVAAILFGRREEAAGSLVLDNRYVLYGHLPGADPGAGGTVWQARDRLGDMRERLVVKMVPSGTVNLERIRMLRHEQRLTAVNSEHIGEILDAGDDRGFTYLVYPWYRPGSLGLHCKQPGPGQTLNWGAQVIYEVLSGLMAASAIGLVHLDVKPGNIVLDGQRARVIDWGLSRKWDAGQPSTWVARGTPFFACPEQLFAPRTGWDTPQADLYGVGATFYWLITGEAPLQYEAYEEGAGFDLTAYRQLLKDGVRPRPVHDLVKGVPRPLSALIDRWLSVDPARRVAPGIPAADVPRVARSELAALMPLPDMRVGWVPSRRRRWPR